MGSSATTQPTRQPVIAWDFDKPSTTTTFDKSSVHFNIDTCGVSKVISE